MTTAHGEDEPATGHITTTEATEQRDRLEDWLQDLRTDLSNDPPGRLDGAGDGLTGSASDEFGIPPAADGDDVEPRPAASETAGRHRAEH
jgi:hypothetical protein